MNAVNLIPADRRKQRLRPSTSPATLALFGGLVLILVGAVLYVSTVNQVRQRRAELSHVTAAAAAWNAAAARFDASVQEMQHRAQELGDIRQLAASRFPWSELLSQIGGVMPSDAALTTMTAAATGSTSSGAATASSTPSSATASAGSAPTVQLSGCAASQSAVAQTMLALQRVSGVTQVNLSSTSASGTGSGSTGSASATGSGGCPFNVTFQVSLTFAPTSTAAPAAAGASPSAGTTASTATPSTTTTTAQ